MPPNFGGGVPQTIESQQSMSNAVDEPVTGVGKRAIKIEQRVGGFHCGCHLTIF